MDAKYTRCYKVTFPGDGKTDHMLLEKVPEAFETFTGRLKDESHVPVAFNDPDKEDGETEAGVSVFDICINTVENQIHQY